ncbi:hypothetical protein OHAE_948 [Ochrobactrum soli]|uniref:Uncharacterized protein n=1 Tax=Ochrobactrum soli TaxID=2448455 RepID=A0A2P9HLV6_9HYPH|nr:hypothetical protein OHAE_948 [[Ochrobactrum] soli]
MNHKFGREGEYPKQHVIHRAGRRHCCGGQRGVDNRMSLKKPGKPAFPQKGKNSFAFFPALA